MCDATRVLHRGGDSPRSAALSPLAAALVVDGRRVQWALDLFWGWRLLPLSWRGWVANGVLGERQPGIGTGSQCDAVVPFGNLPRRRHSVNFILYCRVVARGLKPRDKRSCGDRGLVALFG